MNEFLLDSCTFLGLINTRDVHHKRCKQFFLDHKDDAFYTTTLLYFEAQHGIFRRIQENDFSGLKVKINIKDHFFPVDMDLIRECHRRGLHKIFSNLRGADLIYACLAKIHNHCLVTCDKDFDAYEGTIRVMNLKRLYP